MAPYDERDRAQKMHAWAGWSILALIAAALFLAVFAVASFQGGPQRIDGAAPTPPAPPERPAPEQTTRP